MINTNYSINNNLSRVKDGDLVFHTERGYIEIHHVTDNCIFDKLGTKFDKNGKDPNSIGYPDQVFPVVFTSIIKAINYFAYYQHYMTNDRNFDPRMK